MDTHEIETRSQVAELRAALIVLDDQGIVISINDEAERVFGVPLRDVLGKEAAVLLSTSCGDSERPITLIASPEGKKGITIAPSVLGRRPNGATFPLDLRRFELTLLGRQLFFLQADLLPGSEAQERLTTTGRLAAGIGHDLRNPLAAIRNAFHYVKKRLAGTELEEDARVAQILTIIDQEIQTCAGIVADLLDYARDRTPFLEMCPIAQLVAEAITGVHVPGHVLIVNEVPDTLPVCDLDRSQFRQVIVNLVQNAAEAIPPEREGRVRVTASATQDEMTLTVSDNGDGIPEENLETIFEPLFTSKAQGTGLGLAIVSNIIARHGGTLGVESCERAGTTFTIRLPRRTGR